MVWNMMFQKLEQTRPLQQNRGEKTFLSSFYRMNLAVFTKTHIAGFALVNFFCAIPQSGNISATFTAFPFGA